FGTPTVDGISFTATLPRIPDPGPVKDRVDGAWQAIKARLLTSVSPGYRALREAITPNAYGGCNFAKTEFLELSLVTVAANADATITTYKAASPQKPTHLTTIQEQITHWNSERAPLVTRMTEMLSPEKTMSEVEQKQYDDLVERVQAYDAQIGRLEMLEKVNVDKAVPLAPAAAPVVGQKACSSIRVTPNLPQGALFVRAKCAEVLCHGNKHEAAIYAEHGWKDTPEVALYLKAAVAPGNTTDSAWAGPLAQPRIVDEFVALLRPKTAIGQIAGLPRVPFTTKGPPKGGGGT